LPAAHQLCGSALLVCREQIELRFDRPFVFAVVHAPTGLALFTGEVHSPEEWKAER
jgi:serpin B